MLTVQLTVAALYFRNLASAIILRACNDFAVLSASSSSLDTLILNSWISCCIRSLRHRAKSSGSSDPSTLESASPSSSLPSTLLSPAAPFPGLPELLEGGEKVMSLKVENKVPSAKVEWQVLPPKIEGKKLSQ